MLVGISFGVSIGLWCYLVLKLGWLILIGGGASGNDSSNSGGALLLVLNPTYLLFVVGDVYVALYCRVVVFVLVLVVMVTVINYIIINIITGRNAVALCVSSAMKVMVVMAMRRWLV